MSNAWNRHTLWADLDREFRALVDFSRQSRVTTGFGYMGPDGAVDATKPVELWITCRMTHVFSLAHLYGIAGAAEFADHGVASLLGPLRDHVYGGWYSAVDHHVDEDGHGIPLGGGRKEGYAHAFVVLAATSAVAAGRPGAGELLDAALDVQERFWWEPEFGRVRESWDRAFTVSEDYRGMNANMHTTECYLSAYDVTADRTWLDRAVAILAFAAQVAGDLDWRVAEHFTSTWEPLPEYNRDEPAHPFRPFGVTPGHGLEWSRLMLHARAALEAAGDEPGEWMIDAATHLFERAVADAWDVDGAPGFVYTTDFQGRPVVRERMHWVLCEALGAAVVLGNTLERLGGHGGDVAAVSQHFAEWIGYAWANLREGPGRWYHELTPENRPGSRTWQGKPDTYHISQAVLLPRLPTTPTFAAALRDGLLAPVPADIA